MKATYVELTPKTSNGYEGQPVGREIFKDPITDDGGKKSAKGLLSVLKTDDKYVLYDQETWRMEEVGYLETIFEDGEFTNEITLTEIRKRLSTLIN